MVFDLNEIEKLEIPERSKLYCLEPVGIGTPIVESLTGYIIRLAEAHNIQTGVLVSKMITPALDKHYLVQNAQFGGDAFYKNARIYNGIGSAAADLVNVMEKLTLRNDLTFLTLLLWSDVLSWRGLLRNSKSCCPDCLEEWRTFNLPIYDPLIWHFNVLNYCSKHQRPLICKCTKCDNELPVIHRNSEPGKCPWCGYWLEISKNSEGKTSINDEWQKWVYQEIGSLLRLAPVLTVKPMKRNISQSIQACVSEISAGNIASFARILGLPKVTVWGWYQESSLPTLENLLSITYYLKIPLVDMLFNEVKFNSINSNLKEKSIIPKTRLQNFEEEKVRIYLEEELNNKKEPLSLQQVAKGLNLDKRTIANHFPHYCKAISKRYLNYKNKCKQERHDQDCEEVEEITSKLIGMGVYPSRRMVESYASKPAILRNQEVQSFWKSILNDKLI